MALVGQRMSLTVEKNPELTTDQKEKEMLHVLERELKKVLKNWREYARGVE